MDEENNVKIVTEDVVNINSKLDDICVKIAKKPLELGGDTVEAIFKKIAFIKNKVVQLLDSATQIKSLESSLEALKDMSLGEKQQTEHPAKPQKDRLVLLKGARSLQEVFENFIEFRRQGDKVICEVCGVDFEYSRSLETDFHNKTMAPRFSHLKESLREHIDTETHTSKFTQAGEEAIQLEKMEKQSLNISVRVGRLAYYLIKKGRPDTDFPLLLYMNKKNGSNVGDINHSKNFPQKFVFSCAKAVQQRVSTHLSSRLVATGCRPPVNIIADKFTHQHVMRQLVGAVTLVPDSPQLIQALYLGAPRYSNFYFTQLKIVCRCPRGTGEYLTSNITSVVDPFIEGEQYTGSTGDGVYEHCGVPGRLDTHYSRKGVSTWDKMHRAATVDTKMRNPKELHQKKFLWLNKITLTISKAMRYVNWGREHHHFFEVCKTMIEEGYETSYKSPKFFSETKFANWVVVIYRDFHTSYPALLRTLEETKANLRAGGEKEREQAATADEVQGRMFNLTFALCISLLIDIYNIYMLITNILQVKQQLKADPVCPGLLFKQ